MSSRFACLWLTRDRPFPPNFGGDWIYSARMIEATARAGADVTVLSLGQGGEPPADFPAAVRWRTAGGAPRRVGAGLLCSRLPAIARRFDVPELRRPLAGALSEQPWDAVVIDNIAMGWAAPAATAAVGRRLVYLAHNHETSVRHAAARTCSGPLWKRAALHLDAARIGSLERRLADLAGLIGTVTAEDEALFRAGHPDRHSLVLKPGYDGPRLAPRPLSELTREAIVLGSFVWHVKQTNLLRFLDKAAAPFAAACARLVVVGAMPDAFRRQLAERFPSVTVTGAVDDVTPWLARARLGLIPEETGGGFKHKALGYVFHRVPIAALDGSYAGVPLVPGDSILSFPDMASLAAGALRALDDIALLDRLQAEAFAACADGFDWGERGQELVATIAGFRR